MEIQEKEMLRRKVDKEEYLDVIQGFERGYGDANISA